MPTKEVLSQAFPLRIKAIEVLIEATQPRTENAASLRHIASEIDRVTSFYSRARAAVIYSAFAELLRTVAMLVQWRTAVLGAELEADRFLKAARALHRRWREEYGDATPGVHLRTAASNIADINVVEDVESACRALASAPLPVIFSAEEAFTAARGSEPGEKEPREPPELTVAFLSFRIDDRPADAVHFLTPCVVHDLELEVSVSRWPDGAESLKLTPMSIEPDSSYEFPTFSLPRPKGEPPFHLKDRAGAVLTISKDLKARPFEIKYTASFEPGRSEQPIGVVGQRVLMLEGIDLKHNPITGYHSVDRKLLHIRDRLRGLPLISAAELEDVLTILVPLCSLAARTLNDALFKDVTNEPQFQVEIRNELRREPRIAAELDEHPHAAGGITDLSFRGIRIELKFEDEKPVDFEDCERFIPQTISYVIANGNRIGILCVLDNSPKKTHGFPAEELIGVISRPTKGSEVHIVTVIIQGNFSRPSDLSK